VEDAEIPQPGQRVGDSPIVTTYRYKRLPKRRNL
jgi:hypothetical protein